MKLRPIKTEKDYESALKRLDKIFDAIPGTKEGDELEVLALIIEDYENKNYAIDSPDPIEAIKFRMEQMNMNQSDLADIIGHKSRASEILNKKRKLSLKMIRKLSSQLNISTDILVKEY